MSGFAWVRTDPEALPTGGQFALAGLIAYLLPALAGIAIVSRGEDWATHDPLMAVFFISMIFAYSFLFSWIGLIPGVLLHRHACRSGRGGLLPTLAAALALGLLAAMVLGPVATACALPFAAVYWIALRLLSPATFVAPPENPAPGRG